MSMTTPTGPSPAQTLGSPRSLPHALEVSLLLGILKQAMDSRAPDLADAEHPGWSDRARDAIATVERRGMQHVSEPIGRVMERLAEQEQPR